MSCTRPIPGWLSRTLNPTGKRSIVFNLKDGFSDRPISIPCGKCDDCNLKHSRERAIRCMHEASLYDDNCFLTLTYAPEFLPENRSLDVARTQKFMKDLRIRFPDKVIRSYGAGEYGDQDGRPHYHLLLFNFDFPDKTPWREINGHLYFRSPLLEELWPEGFSSIGDLTFETAAYVARYVMKKFLNKDPQVIKDRWTWIDYKTGEIFDERIPERPICVSLGTSKDKLGGIGKPWLDKFKTDVYPSDQVVLKGKVLRPPKYYDRLLEKNSPDDFCSIKLARKELVSLHEFDERPSWRSVEACTKASLLRKKRGLVETG